MLPSAGMSCICKSWTLQLGHFAFCSIVFLNWFPSYSLLNELIKHKSTPITTGHLLYQHHTCSKGQRLTNRNDYTQQHQHIFQHDHEQDIKDTEWRKGEHRTSRYFFIVLSVKQHTRAIKCSMCVPSTHYDSAMMHPHSHSIDNAYKRRQMERCALVCAILVIIVGIWYKIDISPPPT